MQLSLSRSSFGLPEQPRRRLGVVGYSTRALAEAAVDLGYEVAAVDAFCDQDSLDLGTCRRVERWPQDIIRCAREVACDAWLLGGGMENHPRLVALLADRAQVLGPSRSQLVPLRSVRFLSELAESVRGLQMPPVRMQATAPAREALDAGMDLYKPLRSSGGIEVIDATLVLDRETKLPRGYWQRFIAGRVLGVTTLITREGVRFLGATESLAAEDWPGPRPFIYRGSLGPVELGPAHRETLGAMAARVAERLGYLGYLQADVIEDPSGQLWLLEINPRWTAGMEVLHLSVAERAQSPLAAHLSAFGLGNVASDLAAYEPAMRLAKAIFYAPRQLQLSPEQRQLLQSFRSRQPLDEDAWWNIADVPALGDEQPIKVEAGQPVLTLRVGSNSADGPWAQIRQALLVGLTVARRCLMERVFDRA